MATMANLLMQACHSSHRSAAVNLMSRVCLLKSFALTLLHMRRLRHIFVDERRSLARTDGPADTESAMIMGNSTRAWDRFYDLRFQQRGAANAVNAMPAWRQGMLAASGISGTIRNEPLALPAPNQPSIPDLDISELD